LDNGADPEWAGDAKGMAVGPQTGADACQAEAPTGGHAVKDALSNRGPAEGHSSQASGAVAYRTGMEQAAPHPAIDLHFGPQTASGAMFMDQSSERGSESREYGDIRPPFPSGGWKMVSSSAWANLMPTMVSVHTMCTTTLTSTMVTCTALGGPAYVPYVSGQPQGGGIDVCPSCTSSLHVALCRTIGEFPERLVS